MNRTLAVLALTFGLGACDKSSGGAAQAGPDAAHAPATSSPSSPSPGRSAAPAPSSSAAADPLDAILGDGGAAVTRDDEEVTIDGVKELWRLEWTKAPAPDCVGTDWGTCPCAGFAFGEKGSMDLVRPARAQKPEERLTLDPLFEGGTTRMARWVATKGDTGKAPDPIELAMRPASSVLKLADYDHDGHATEFLLQVAAGPCGHTPTIAVGISASNGKLHALSSVEKPEEPLELEHASDWTTLAKKPRADIIQIACGDHGASESVTLHVVADGLLHAATETKKCP